MSLTRRAALQRGTKRLKRTRLSWKPRTVPYGGASAEFPDVGDFQEYIRQRDHACQVCGRVCGPLQVAHLLYKVQMGGRKVSVNQRWNACVLGEPCHRAQETDRELTAWLVKRLVRFYGYVLPAHALERLERYAAVSRNVQEAEEWPGGFDARLSIVDGRA